MKTSFSSLLPAEARRAAYDRMRDPVCIHFLDSRKKLISYTLARHFKIVCPESGEVREVMIRFLRPISPGEVLRPEDFRIVLFCRFLKQYFGGPDNPDDHVEFDHQRISAFIVEEFRRGGYLDQSNRLYSKKRIIELEEARERARKAKERARQNTARFFRWRKEQGLLAGKESEA